MTEAGAGLVGGRYRLLDAVGVGGMGRVWRGHDEVLDREVAIKEILFPDGMGGPERELFARRALREARSAARLNHPGIITVHDVTTHEGAPVIVMEFVRGSSLADVIAQEGRLPPGEVARIGAAMVEALTEAHAAGVVHRDLKPANVLVSGSRVVITDFGIASLASDPTLTRSGMLMGTPAFMSPEQAKGLPVTPAGDLWSLGATLYAAVEGHPPYTGPNVVAVLAALLTQDPPAPVHAGPLAPVLTALLQREAVRRPSAEAVLTDLTEAASLPAPVPRTDEPPAPAPRTDEPPASDTTEAPPPPTSLLGRRSVLGAATLGLVGVGVSAVLLSRDPAARSLPTPTPARPTPTPTPTTSAPVKKPTPWKKAAVLTGHHDSVMSLAFSPDGDILASASAEGAIDSRSGSVRLWDMSGKKHPTIRHLRAAPRAPRHTNAVQVVAFSPDGATLAGGCFDNTVWLWNAATGGRRAVLTGHAQPVYAVAFSPDGDTLVTCDSVGVIQFRNAATGAKRATRKGHNDLITAAAFSPDGRILATASMDDTVSLWDPVKAKRLAILTGHLESWAYGFSSVAFSPDGDVLATGSSDKTARLWDLTVTKDDVTGKVRRQAFTGHREDVEAVAFTPDGRTLATASVDKTVRLWNVATGEQTAKLTGHTSEVLAVAFSPDGRTLATAGMDSSIRLWRKH